jgi:cell division protein FtsQ
MRTYRKPHKIRRKTSIFKRRLFWIFILVLIFFIGSAYLVSFASFFDIKEIQINGNQKVSTDDIKQLVNEKIIRNFWKFSSKSIFLANLGKAKDDLLKEFPQIEDINFQKKLPGSLIVEAKERTAVAIFCPDIDCFLVDKGGTVFEKTDVLFSEFPKIKNIQGKSNFSLGEKIIDEKILTFISDVKSKLNEKLKIDVEEFNVPSLQRLNVKTKERWEIYFNLEGDLNWQIEKLILVLEKEIPPEKRKDLEYIDLRFTRVYFKYR